LTQSINALLYKYKEEHKQKEKMMTVEIAYINGWVRERVSQFYRIFSDGSARFTTPEGSVDVPKGAWRWAVGID
jgi:hypothetical protein